MGMVRLALVFGGLTGEAVVGACGLEAGGPGGDVDSGGDPDVMIDGAADITMLPDAPMDIMTPDLGTGETESGVLCTCTAAVPNTWSVVVYSPKTRTMCGNDFDSSSDVIEDPVAQPATCMCTCSSSPQTQPTCTGSLQFSLNFDSGSSCNNQSFNITVGSMCTAGPFGAYSATGNRLNMMAVTGNPPNAGGGTCGGVNVTKGGPAPTSDEGRTCKPKVPPGKCGPGLCVPTPMAPDIICILKAGIQLMCPAGFPNTHYVGTGGNPITDGRICTPSQVCTLNRGTCSTPSMSLWPSGNTMCNNNPANTEPVDSSCNTVSYGNGPLTFGSASYSSNNSGASCSYGGTCTASGTVTPANVVTICCL